MITTFLIVIICMLLLLVFFQYKENMVLKQLSDNYEKTIDSTREVNTTLSFLILSEIDDCRKVLNSGEVMTENAIKIFYLRIFNYYCALFLNDLVSNEFLKEYEDFITNTVKEINEDTSYTKELKDKYFSSIIEVYDTFVRDYEEDGNDEEIE